MKTKTLIYHRTFTFTYILLVVVIFYGCENRSTSQTSTEKLKNSGRIIYNYGWNTTVRVFEVDGCEYIGFDNGSNGGTSIIHKQNCKFCTERNKK